MMTQPTWFKALCYSELALQLPTFFLLSYGILGACDAAIQATALQQRDVRAVRCVCRAAVMCPRLPQASQCTPPQGAVCPRCCRSCPQFCRGPLRPSHHCSSAELHSAVDACLLGLRTERCTALSTVTDH